MNIYTYCIIALCGALLWAATGCGDGSSTKDDELFWCKYDNQVLRVELCNMGRREFCDE